MVKSYLYVDSNGDLLSELTGLVVTGLRQITNPCAKEQVIVLLIYAKPWD